MKYLSVCSGIEAATVAWHPLGWTPFAFSEIDRFPSEVLARHYGSNLPGEPLSGNAPPNLGDMTNFQEWPDAAIDVLVGGTPCQSFSVAGLRKGLADPRGNLALTYLAIADRYRPKWMVWENVPGVLSSGGGRDFGAFLGGLGELGYGWAYRVLDAQYVLVDGFGRAVPQRRRRVFVVGHLGDWRRAAAVLFEPESLSGHPAPRREAGQRPAPTLSARTQGGGGLGTDFDLDGGLIAKTLLSGGHSNNPLDENLVAAFQATGDGFWREGVGPLAVSDDNGTNQVVAHTIAPALSRNPYGDHESREGLLVAHTLKAEGFDASEDGTGRGIPLVPIAFNSREDPEVTWDRSGPLGASSPQAQAIAYGLRNDASREGEAKTASPDASGNVRLRDPGFNVYEGFAPTLDAGAPHAVASGWAVRRLTPTECERLQGFPDGYTAIPRGGKPAADGPRYKALGNSMAVNAMRWIGRRIEMVEALERELAKGEAA